MESKKNDVLSNLCNVKWKVQKMFSNLCNVKWKVQIKDILE